MEGIEILNATSIYNTLLPEWTIVIGVMLIFVFAIMATVCICIDRYGWMILCVVLTIVTIVAIAFGSNANKNSIHHMEYKVTINDSVKMNDFFEQYEIIDQEGKIYTVREKE